MVEALAHFNRVDNKLFTLALMYADTISIPKKATKNQYFELLSSSIISQQLSVKAADTIETRVRKTLGICTPINVLAAEVNDLRAAGLSRQKITYLHSLANHWSALTTESFDQLSNEEIITRLTSVKGVGRWTAEMFLLSAMARSDVFSYGDLILRTQLYQLHELDYKQDETKAKQIAASWAPHRSIASFVLWSNKGK